MAKTATEAGIGAPGNFEAQVRDIRALDRQIDQLSARREALRLPIVAAMQAAGAGEVDVDGLAVVVYTRAGNKTLDKRRLLEFISADDLAASYKTGKEVTVFQATPTERKDKGEPGDQG